MSVGNPWDGEEDEWLIRSISPKGQFVSWIHRTEGYDSALAYKDELVFQGYKEVTVTFIRRPEEDDEW